MQRTIRSEDEKAALIVRFQQSGLRPREFCREGPKNQTPIFQGRRGRPCREAMIRASRRVSRLKPEPLPVRATATSACGPPRTTPGPVGGRADLRRGLDPQGRGQPLRRPARRRPGQPKLQGLRRRAAMARKRPGPRKSLTPGPGFGSLAAVTAGDPTRQGRSPDFRAAFPLQKPHAAFYLQLPHAVH